MPHGISHLAIGTFLWSTSYHHHQVSLFVSWEDKSPVTPCGSLNTHMIFNVTGQEGKKSVETHKIYIAEAGAPWYWNPLRGHVCHELAHQRQLAGEAAKFIRHNKMGTITSQDIQGHQGRHQVHLVFVFFSRVTVFV